jgi:hypothetical protein
MINQHINVHFGRFVRISRILKVNRDFQMSKMTPVIISKVDYITVYEEFEKRFRILTNFVGEPPQLEAQPPHAVTEPNSLPFIFPLLFIIYIYSYLLCLFIYLLYLFFLLLILLLLYFIFIFNYFFFFHRKHFVFL